jgi:hypothetical protein
MSHTAAKELKEAAKGKGKGKGASGSRSPRGASPPAASHASSAEPLFSFSSGKKPSKFKFLMTYMFGQCCASAQRKHDMQERLYHLEQRASIESSPPLPFVPPRDPMALYDEAGATYEDDASSLPHGKSKATDKDKDYIEEDKDDDGDDGGGDHDDDDDDYEDE